MATLGPVRGSAGARPIAVPDPMCRQRPVAVSLDLAELRGSLTGMVRLPLQVYSSGAGPRRVFDLADEAERIELYQIVLTDGRTEDVCAYLNEHELRRLWPRLWLPPHVRRAWHPHLGAAAS
jgi:hypothetical protein